MQVLRALLVEKYAPATVNKMLAAVRGVLHECQRLDLLDSNVYAKTIDVPSVRGTRLPAGRALEPKEFTALLKQTERAPLLGIRDRAILMLLGYGGLRRDEVSQLDLEHYDAIQRVLRVLGKGNKEREVPLHVEVVASIDAWLEVRGHQSGALFWQGAAGDLLRTGQRLGHRGIYALVVRLAKAGDVKKLSPHDLRRTLISNLLDSPKGDISTVAHFVGHASTDTTKRYDRRGKRAMRAAIDSLPSVGKK